MPAHIRDSGIFSSFSSTSKNDVNSQEVCNLDLGSSSLIVNDCFVRSSFRRLYNILRSECSLKRNGRTTVFGFWGKFDIYTFHSEISLDSSDLSKKNLRHAPLNRLICCWVAVFFCFCVSNLYSHVIFLSAAFKQPCMSSSWCS